MTTRLEYSVEALREQVVARRDARVAEAEATYKESVDLAGRRERWRAEQEKRVRSLSRRLARVPDNELGSFRVPPCPVNDSSFRTPERDRDTAIERAEDSCARALRRLEAIEAPSGKLSLTANMLSDWFGL